MKKFLSVIALILLAHCAHSLNLRQGTGIKPEIDEERFTEVFSYTLPIDKKIDESRFTEKFEFSIPV